MQIAEHLIAAILSRRLNPGPLQVKMRIDQRLGFDIFPLQQQLPDFGQIFICVRSVGVLPRAGPDGTFVEHNSLFVHAAEHHRAQPPIAQRRRFREICCRGVEPDRCFRREYHFRRRKTFGRQCARVKIENDATVFIFIKSFIQPQNESATRRNLMPPLIRISQRYDSHLHVGILAFGNYQPMWKLLECGQIQIYRQGAIRSVDARNEPAFAGTSRKNGNFSRLANQAFGFIPARGSIAEDLQRLRRQRFKKFRLVGVMNDAGGKNQCSRQFDARPWLSGRIFWASRQPASRPSDRRHCG